MLATNDTIGRHCRIIQGLLELGRLAGQGAAHRIGDIGQEGRVGRRGSNGDNP
jgi:hypothetical protein